MGRAVPVIECWGRGDRRPRVAPAALQQSFPPRLGERQHLIGLLALLRQQREFVNVHAELPAVLRPEQAAVRQMLVTLDEPEGSRYCRRGGS